PHVDLVTHSVEGLDVARTRALAPGTGQGELRLPVAFRREDLDPLRHGLEVVPAANELIVLVFSLLLAQAPGIVGSPGVARKRAPEDERRRPLRVARCEEQGQRTAFG